VALENASTSFFPPLEAVFGYGGHTMASTVLGWDEDTLLAVPGDVPVLLAGGTRDGVIARSADRYGREGHARDPITRTFEDAVPPGTTAYLAIVEGANHFAIGTPHDPTVARGFLDLDPVGDEDRQRALLGDLVAAFLRRHLLEVDDDLDVVMASSLLSTATRRGG
jgi:hypothetical protein